MANLDLLTEEEKFLLSPEEQERLATALDRSGTDRKAYRATFTHKPTTNGLFKPVDDTVRYTQDGKRRIGNRTTPPEEPHLRGQAKWTEYIGKDGKKHTKFIGYERSEKSDRRQAPAYQRAYKEYLERSAKWLEKNGGDKSRAGDSGYMLDLYYQRMLGAAKAQNQWEHDAEINRRMRNKRHYLSSQPKVEQPKEPKERKAVMGVVPWDSSYNDWKRLNKLQQAKQGVRHTTQGWQKTLGKDWDKENPVTTKRVKLANGRWATVIDSGLGVPLGYEGASATAFDDKGMSSLDYVAKAFEDGKKTYDQEGCGHIANMRYSQSKQLLLVEFAEGGDIVVYFRVPPAVVGELYYLAKSKVTSTNTFDGSERHVLGIRFWDLIRIRGTLHGSRYRFEYVQEGSRTGGPIGRPVGTGSTELREVHTVRPESTGYDIELLKKALADYEEANGHKPSPEEYKDMIAKLHAQNPRGERRPHASDTWTTKRLPKRYSDDTLDSYFSTRYNRDLTNKNINRNKLQDAYHMYDTMGYEEPMDVVNLLRKAGVKI